MRFTKYGTRELAIYGTVAGVVMIAAIVLSFSYASRADVAALISLPFILTFIWVLSFFRDPKRVVPRGEHRLVAPADGMIFDIADVDEPDFIGEECTRIGIFLSIFDCHINRVPCSGTVETIRYKRGAFHSALKAKQCSRRNESNFIGISNAAGTGAKVAVKQIAGQIARRIVCDLEECAEVERGQQFGMIKFGSRTELFIPKSANFTLKVKLGAAVCAGRTVIGTLEPPLMEIDEGETE
ncbi:MAG: phosphatidylserine decarboxylase [Planctomycetota bacterium]